MSDALQIVDGLDLSSELRAVHRPGEEVEDVTGRTRRLPRFFYEVASWAQARELTLCPRMAMYEFMDVDVFEAEAARTYPRYIPCAVAMLAANLSVLRKHVDTYVHVSANGGYRSPGHRRDAVPGPHQWASAADIYRIGNDYMSDRDTIEKYAGIVRELLPAARCAPYGHGEGESDDHLHVELGFLTVDPAQHA